MPHTRNGNGLSEWPTARGRDQPIVVRITPETARVLKLSLDELTRAVEGLEVWGRHASGEPVYRATEVLEAIGQAPPERNGSSARGGRAAAARTRKPSEAR